MSGKAIHFEKYSGSIKLPSLVKSKASSGRRSAGTAPQCQKVFKHSRRQPHAPGSPALRGSQGVMVLVNAIGSFDLDYCPLDKSLLVHPVDVAPLQRQDFAAPKAGHHLQQEDCPRFSGRPLEDRQNIFFSGGWIWAFMIFGSSMSSAGSNRIRPFFTAALKSDFSMVRIFPTVLGERKRAGCSPFALFLFGFDFCLAK